MTDPTISQYWATRAEGYSDRTVDEFTGSRGLMWEKRLKKALNEAPAGDVVDIGCGPGLFALIAARCGRRTTGIDVTPEMIERARGNHKKLAPNLAASFLIGDAAHLPFDDASVACIISRYVIWNLPDPVAALTEFMRVLMPGGVLFYVDGNHYRYLTDTKWAELHAKLTPVYGHEDRFVKGVDTSPMERIAAGLPLTAVDRPEWDRDALKSLGYRKITTEVLAIDKIDRTSEALVTEFSVTSQKPL